jgi:hypothetical protein
MGGNIPLQACKPVTETVSKDGLVIPVSSSSFLLFDLSGRKEIELNLDHRLRALSQRHPR